MIDDVTAVARHLAERGKIAFSENKILEGIDLFERAYTASMMLDDKIPISFKFLFRKDLQQLSSDEHILAYISKNGIIFFAVIDFILCPCSDFRRLPLIGRLCANAAQAISGAETFQCVFDTGDGTDTGQYPRIAYSSTLPQASLILDPYFHIYENYNELRAHVSNHAKPWRERKDILFWRGTTTGQRLRTPGPDESLTWDWHPRLQLCAASRSSRYAEKMDIAIGEMGQIGEQYLQDAITSAGFLQPLVSKKEFTNYKYLVDIDGYSNSWGLIEKFIMGATVFKVRSGKGYRQWYYHRLEDWKTHIPVAPDLSDLDDRMGWALTHPEACERIAANGAALAADVQLPAALREAEHALTTTWTLATTTPLSGPARAIDSEHS
jgi:hypothetical protein